VISAEERRRLDGREDARCDYHIISGKEVELLPLRVGFVWVTWLHRIAKKYCSGGLLFRYRRFGTKIPLI
jgi:hypothetical protein